MEGLSHAGMWRHQIFEQDCSASTPNIMSGEGAQDTSQKACEQQVAFSRLCFTSQAGRALDPLSRAPGVKITQMPWESFAGRNAKKPSGLAKSEATKTRQIRRLSLSVLAQGRGGK